MPVGRAIDAGATSIYRVPAMSANLHRRDGAGACCPRETAARRPRACVLALQSRSQTPSPPVRASLEGSRALQAPVAVPQPAGRLRRQTQAMLRGKRTRPQPWRPCLRTARSLRALPASSSRMCGPHPMQIGEGCAKPERASCKHGIGARLGHWLGGKSLYDCVCQLSVSPWQQYVKTGHSSWVLPA